MSITELAKLRQVTSETLRYYDRIGLITPDYVDPQTRYRYYSIRQYEKLGTIKELRQLGMSIHDITDYFSGRNLRKSHQLLLHQLELLEEEIRKQQLLSEILRRKLHFLSEIILRMVWQAVGAVNIPVVGLGGIATGKDALEFIMAGATAVQVGAANFANPRAMETIAEEMAAWMDAHGVKTLDEIRGCAR